MMRRLSGVIGILGIAGLLNCGSPTAEELASLAAKGYYDHLVRGEYEQFVQGMSRQELVGREDYRSQLIDNCRQFMAQQQKAHHGILDVRIASASTDTLDRLTNVFLVLCYGDSTNEQIVVPMVEHQGRWRMR